MKKTYRKLTTDLLLVETEGSFMQCSVRGKMMIEVEEYSTHTFSGDNAFNNGSEWKIGFDE